MTEHGPLTAADVERARQYITRPDLVTVPGAIAWIQALADTLDEHKPGHGEALTPRESAVQFMDSAAESDTTDQAQATAIGALAWAVLAVVDELRELRSMLAGSVSRPRVEWHERMPAVDTPGGG